MKFLRWILVSFLALPYTVFAEVGVTDTTITLGMSNALSGPASGLGTGVKAGTLAYFEKINQQGGVHGRQIKVISLDDGYEPDRAAKNAKRLIYTDKVFALVSFVGTPTSKAVVPEVNRAKVPYIGPFTGAEFLRTPANPNIFNIRASYFNETEKLVNHFINDLGYKKIAVFIQDDGYGAAGKAGVQRALRKRGLKIHAEGRYTRNTLDVEQGLNSIMSKNPDAVILVGAYKACGAFIKLANQKGFDAKFANISFVGTKKLIAELGADGNGSYISQVMPNPDESDLRIIEDFKKDLAAQGVDSPYYTQLEGYLNAMVIVEALQQAGQSLTRSNFVSAMENISNKNFGGLNVNFSKSDRQGLDDVYLTKIENGKAIPVNSMK
ncbi:Leucine-, isoleucine-, valine-, threonine-, and alanine-binding protein precursor [Grimontia celer]|uniref:Leucine-, isoleucine-, valine-, threonine-, and alanine-binding protein n=1 Tax=Grimontia celer TaxID=1796497 RepID=A0A128F318_9GAMM|nr:ABC transporter substrate-binding protein [Grimontia celer]CZF81192.1 Leucine-, isoleucine-, valine-, threonine-, and alanine-binding protein precursor [Grimontia celer]